MNNATLFPRIERNFQNYNFQSSNYRGQVNSKLYTISQNGMSASFVVTDVSNERGRFAKVNMQSTNIPSVRRIDQEYFGRWASVIRWVNVVLIDAISKGVTDINKSVLDDGDGKLWPNQLNKSGLQRFAAKIPGNVTIIYPTNTKFGKFSNSVAYQNYGGYVLKGYTRAENVDFRQIVKNYAKPNIKVKIRSITFNEPKASQYPELNTILQGNKINWILLMSAMENNLVTAITIM